MDLNNNVIYSLILVLIAIVIYYLQIRPRLKKTVKPSNNSKMIDSNSPSLPNKKFKFRPITLEESWQFLNKITDLVINHFSRNDQSRILNLGMSLSKAGLIYCHVIEYGVRNIGKDRKINNEVENVAKIAKSASNKR